MHLDADDERILAGEQGETRQKMLELLVALGKVFGAERLVPIRSAQVSGASYKTIGKYGLEWLQQPRCKSGCPGGAEPDRDAPRTAGRRWVSMRDFAQKPAGRCCCLRAARDRPRMHLHAVLPARDLVRRPPRVVGVLRGQLRKLGDRGPDQPRGRARRPCRCPDRKDALLRVSTLQRTGNRRWSSGCRPIPATGRIAHYGALGYHTGKLVGNRIPFFSGISPDTGPAQGARGGNGGNRCSCPVSRRRRHAGSGAGARLISTDSKQFPVET